MIYDIFLTTCLQEASHIALRSFGKVKGTVKPTDSNQVLTATDLAISTLLIQKIQKLYPTHNIIDEEAGVIDHGSAYTWVIDPIDGTSNFAVGLPLFGVMMGLLENDTVIAGGVTLPFFQEIILAEKGQGAYCNGIKLSVTKERNLSASLLAISIDSHPGNPQKLHPEIAIVENMIQNTQNVRISGSVFDAMQVAKGKMGGMLNFTSKIWDNAAQQVIIEEAGGVYTDLYGKSMDYAHPLTKYTTNYTHCLASPTLHQQIQHLIHA